MIFAFHTRIHLDASYGILNEFVTMGAIFMTAFFMLSGFSLFVNHAGTNLIEKKSLKTFWLKRFIGIIPMYYLCGLIYALTPFDQDLPWQRVFIAPIEILGIQSDFSGLFGHSHNGGTWFISCIIICYLVYPLLQELVKMMSARTKRICLAICIFILLYSPLVAWAFQTASIYDNPFFRALEFFIGMLLASMKLNIGEKSQKLLYNWWTIGIATVLMIVGVTVAMKLGIGVGNYMLYSWICLPSFCVILSGLSGVKFHHNENRILSEFCAASYVVFLSQLYSNAISVRLINKLQIQSNIIVLIIGWGVGLGISFVLRGIEKTINRQLKSYLLKS